jgi:hypothetical protein
MSFANTPTFRTHSESFGPCGQHAPALARRPDYTWLRRPLYSASNLRHGALHCTGISMGDAKRRQEREKKIALVERESAAQLTKSGHAYFARFPFTIHAVKDGSAPFNFHINERRVRVYWPFVTGGGNAPATPQADWVRAPVPDGVPPIADIWPRLHVRAAPRYQGHSGEYIQADSLRVEIWPAPPAEEVDELITQFAGLLRWWTHQWWIGRDERFLAPPSTTALMIDDTGRIAGTTFNAFVLPLFLGFEKILDESAFIGACAALARGVAIPYAYSTLFDASYFHATRERERFVMSISIACDASILHAAQRLADRKGFDVKVYERRLNPQDQLYNLDKGLADLIGVSFREADPDSFAALAMIWKARGRVAHGKSPTISIDRIQRNLTGEEQVQAIDAAVSLFAFLETHAGAPPS